MDMDSEAPGVSREQDLAREQGLDRQPNSSGCFICGLDNPIGLRMVFHEDREAGQVVAELAVPERYRSYPGVVHGGIQATLLDGTMGKAAQVHTGLAWTRARIATVEFRIRYRRPVPVEELLTIRAELVRTEGRDLYLKGQILNAAEEILTTAEARWRELDMPSE